MDIDMLLGWNTLEAKSEAARHASRQSLTRRVKVKAQ